VVARPTNQLNQSKLDQFQARGKKRNRRQRGKSTVFQQISVAQFVVRRGVFVITPTSKAEYIARPINQSAIRPGKSNKFKPKTDDCSIQSCHYEAAGTLSGPLSDNR